MLIAAIALLVFGAAIAALALLAPTSSQVLDMYLTVANYTGFNVNTSALFFGTIPPGSQSTRELSITNSGNTTTRVELQPSSELAAIVSIAETGFSLAPGENRSVAVTATVPIDMPYGNYTGKLLIQYFG